MPITISQTIRASRARTWELYTHPTHVTAWNAASPDWHCPNAASDLRAGGKFNYRMEARDGSMGFDFWGVYDSIEALHSLHYTLGDGRQVAVSFAEGEDSTTLITQTFEPENQNPLEMQRQGWQAILDSFKRYAEGL